MKNIHAIMKVYVVLIWCALAPLMAQSTAGADSVVPGVVRFAGVLNDGAGQPLSGNVGVTFFLYKEQSGGAPLWMETQNVQADPNGRYSVTLGSTTKHGIPADAFATGEARWIGVQASGKVEQARVQLVSVPYALKAADAQTLGGLSPSAFLLAPSPALSAGGPAGGATESSAVMAPAAVTGTGIANFVPLWTSASTMGNSALFESGTGSSTKIGINTTTPQAMLDVKGPVTVRSALTLPASATAKSTAGANSSALGLVASAFNSGTQTASNQVFHWQAEPAGNNTATPSATLNLLFGTPPSPLAETGLKINNKGQVTFAPGQTFPGGGGTVTSVGLTAPFSDFTVGGSPVTGNGTLNLQWLTPPTANNVLDAIVKRDSSGSFSTSNITVSSLVSASSLAASNANTGNVAVISGFASARGNAGLTTAVFARSDSDSGRGVWAQTFGVNSSAVYAETAGSAATAVFGHATSSGGIGVSALNNNGGDAIYAEALNGGFAAFFNGDVDVDGRLSKAAGSFKIDHPLDPANKYLYHSFVESPDMMNVYNGNIVTDSQGRAVVEMPEWFEALNRDFRYQLTTIGQLALATVESEVANHQFTIQTDKPNVKVSWQVTGIRQDVYANAHRIPVEEAKPDKERGFYLHPELFGAPSEKSIAASRHPIAVKVAKSEKELSALHKR
jgi:hypothetical protein